MLKKTRNCKSCGVQIAPKGKVICSNCGTVNKPPFSFKIIYIIITILLSLNIIYSVMVNDEPLVSLSSGYQNISTTDTNGVTLKPTIITTDKLCNDLETNVSTAVQTYDGIYVKLTGKLSDISTAEDYFLLIPMNDDESQLSGVKCYIDDSLIGEVRQFTMGQTVTIFGTIVEIDEYTGYTLVVKSIV